MAVHSVKVYTVSCDYDGSECEGDFSCDAAESVGDARIESVEAGWFYVARQQNICPGCYPSYLKRLAAARSQPMKETP